MRITDEGIEDTVQWTIVGILIVACALAVLTVGNSINQSLLGIGVL